MTPPKIETVDAVTIEHGRTFADGWYAAGSADGRIAGIMDACDVTEVLKWPQGETIDEELALDAREGATDRFFELTHDICSRVFVACREQIAAAFTRAANLVIYAERQRESESLVPAPLRKHRRKEPVPPRIETIDVITEDNADAFVSWIHEQAISSGAYAEAIESSGVLTWPGENDILKLDQYVALSDEIRDNVFERIRPAFIEAFIRVAGEVTRRERRRR
ncbi:MAG: hypothetical protein ACRD3J_28390 [Thermoanaerobaculia bacterium]